MPFKGITILLIYHQKIYFVTLQNLTAENIAAKLSSKLPPKYF